MTTVDSLRRVLAREIETLRIQVRSYATDDEIWRQPAGFPNSAGTLTLHMAGGLQHFIGAALGNSGYVRNREREFAARGLSREELLAELAAAQAALDLGLGGQAGDGRADGGRADAARAGDRRAGDGPPDQRLLAPYPLEFGGSNLDTGTVLLRLVAHFGYHLGQIDIHRRLVTGNAEAIEEPPIAMLEARPGATGAGQSGPFGAPH